ncbi:MAG: hypothetical protein ACFFDN_23305 [Candidatus Hodarchaeota archaeon]
MNDKAKTLFDMKTKFDELLESWNSHNKRHLCDDLAGELRQLCDQFTPDHCDHIIGTDPADGPGCYLWKESDNTDCLDLFDYCPECGRKLSKEK